MRPSTRIILFALAGSFFCNDRTKAAIPDVDADLKSPATWKFPLPAGRLTPRVTFNGGAVALAASAHEGGLFTWKVQAAGKEVAVLEINGASKMRLTELLTVEESGTFSYGLSVAVPGRARLFDLDCTNADASTPAVEKFYPYNWNLCLKPKPLLDEAWRNVTDRAQIDLVIPGFETGGVYYSKESWRLAQIAFQGVPGGVKIELMRNREINQGHDAISNDLPLIEGSTDTMSILAASSMKELLNERFGEPNPATGRLTFAYNAGWPTANPAGALTPEDYGNFARQLRGSYDIAIVRSWRPHDYIAKAFNANGMAAYCYLMNCAVRRNTRDTIPPIPDPAWQLKDTNGTFYTAPHVDSAQRRSAWAILNVRNPEVRKYLISQAVTAIAEGYQGIFLDSPYFFVGSDGYVGGNDPGATESMAYARDLLFQETKAAITKINPKARLSMLGNTFFDGEYLADFVYNENYANTWISNDDNPWERSLENSPEHPVAWDKSYRQYMQGSYMLGQKGENPLIVGTWLNWGRALPDRWFTEDNQIVKIKGSYQASSDSLAKILRAVSQYARSPHGTIIHSTNPDGATIADYGPSILGVPTPTRFTLSASSPMLDLATLAITTGTTQTLNATDRYIIAERHEDDHWNWTGYGFAFLDRGNYLYGDGYFLARPAGDAKAEMKFVVETSPGPLTPGHKPNNLGAFKPYTMTFHLEKTPRTIRVTDAKGNATDSSPAAAHDVFTVTLPARPEFATYTVELLFGSSP